MARRKTPQPQEDWLFPNLPPAGENEQQSSLLDVLDNVLNKGAVLNGDLVLGVANVDLIYAKLSVLLSAIDKVMKPVQPPRRALRTRRLAKAGKRKK
jgi:Gas vesicle protein